MDGKLQAASSAQQMSALLRAPLLRLLRANPDGMKIHHLVTELSVEEGVDLDVRNSDPLGIFRINFVVMNALFNLQRSLDKEAFGLEISTLMVKVFHRTKGSSSHALDSASNARLGDYYLDWSNLEQTTEVEIQQMMDTFWKRYWSVDRAAESYDALGLSPGADVGEVRRAFRRLATIHHPDKGGDAGRFLVIREAYENLIRR